MERGGVSDDGFDPAQKDVLEDRCLRESSTDVDDSQKEGGRERPDKPWWADHPDIEAARREVAEWLEAVERRPLLDEAPDPVVVDFFSGRSLRELVAAREDLDRARVRYADAVRSARAAGLSWAEIARVLGVSKQLLHRRFRNDVG